MVDDPKWRLVQESVLQIFQQRFGNASQGLKASRVAGLFKALGVSEVEARSLLATFGLASEDDEIDFDAIVNWIFDDVVPDTGNASVNVADLAPQLADAVANCGDALAHVMYVQSADTSDRDAAEKLHMLIGGTRQSRIGVIGSISYDFPGIRYKAHGPEAVERIVQAAAEAVVTKGVPTRVVCGGSYAGPQKTFAEVCEAHAWRPLTMVHVIPNKDSALKDLKGILWDGNQPRQRKCRWRIAFVGSNFSRRNCILASLNGNYVMCGGGPGTHTELCELRYNGAGLLPLVRTGGLAEGAEFGEKKEKNTRGMVDALRRSPPCGVPEEQWKRMLGDGEPSLEEYCSAVKQVFGALRFRNTLEPSNRWPMDAKERKEWDDTKQKSPDFDKAKS